ncbi:MAG: hypothetical protein HY720_25775 [Planctomycetes bacterium]|nr:hypothetical protein [Planctomycetota bacterium]
MKIFRLAFQFILFGGSLAVLIGVAVAIGQPKPPRTDPDEGEKGPLVWVRTLEREEYDGGKILAYGTVRAPRVYAVRSMVGGKVVEVAENFVEGRVVRKDEAVCRIDEADIKVALAQAQARIAEIEASKAKIEVDLEPLRTEIARLAQEKIELEKDVAVKQQEIDRAKTDVETQKRLYEKNAVSKAVVDAAESTLNRHEQAILVPKSRLAQLPLLVQAQEAQIKAVQANEGVLAAQLDAARSNLEQQQTNLTRTSVPSPATGVVLRREPATGLTAKQLSQGDVVQSGQDLAWVMPIDEGLEIAVSIDVDDAFFIRGMENVRGLKLEPGVDPRAMLALIPAVVVRWYGKTGYSWSGKIDRFLSELNAETRTLTVVVKVEDPGRELLPGEKIPLTVGMYCEVEIPASIVPDAVVLPRSVLREGSRVFLATKEDRLAVREVKPVRMTREHAIVLTDLSAGERVVLSDLPNAVEGMAIRTREEKAGK